MKFKDPKAHCAACGKKGCDIHHIKSRGSRPDLAQEAFNSVPLCRVHHSFVHAVGLSRAVARFPRLGACLERLGWKEMGVKWHHPKANEEIGT